MELGGAQGGFERDLVVYRPVRVSCYFGDAEVRGNSEEGGGEVERAVCRYVGV